MNYSYIFLLLLVVLSAYSESPKYANPPPIEVTVFPNGSFAQLGILAPVLPHNEVYKTTLPHNEVFKTILPQNEVYKIALSQHEAKLNKTVLIQTRVFKIHANCQLSDSVKMIINFVLNHKIVRFRKV